MLKTAVLTALAAPAMAQTYSSPFAEVVVANAAKFADGTAAEVTQKSLTVASLLAASTTPTVGALADVATALSGSAGVTTISNTACQEAYRAASEFHYGDLTTTSLNDWNFEYAWRYLEEAVYDQHVTALKACLTAMNPSNLATLTSSVDAAKAAITLYPGKIDLDWTQAANYINSGATAIPLTTAQQADYYINMLMFGQAWCGLEYFANSDNGATPLIPNAQYTSPPSDFLTTINALETSWNFATVTDFNNYYAMEDKKDFIGDTNALATLVSHQAAINAAFGYTTTTTPTLAQIEAAGIGYDNCKTAVQQARVVSQAYYNGAALNTFGLLSLFLVMLTQW